MKSRFNIILFTLLVLQLGVAVSMHQAKQSVQNEQFNQPILDFKQASVDKISIDDGQGQQCVISRSDNQWRLDNYFRLPADSAKIKRVLERLGQNESGWPVATTESSRLRFKVADNDYRKKLKLTTDVGEQALYLGVSPGFRQINVRRQGEEQVYSVKLNDYEFSLKDADWLDKTLLQVKDDLSSLQGNGFSLKKDQGKWMLENTEAETDSKAVEKLATTLTHLRVLSAEQQEVQKDAVELKLGAGGRELQYQLFKTEKDYFIKRNDYEPVFKISQADYQELVVARASQFVIKPDTDEMPDASESDNPS